MCASWFHPRQKDKAQPDPEKHSDLADDGQRHARGGAESERLREQTGARFVYADLQDDGTVVIDFNEAYNPPCAFNPYTTCPIPLKENQLPIKVLAGEKDYPVHVPLGRATN